MQTLTENRFSNENGRSCDGCSMCCYILEIEELNKPMGSWCKNCSTRKGCDVYPEHPSECRDYQCGYLVLDELFGEEWKPSKSKMVVSAELEGRRFRVNVHPSYPLRWKDEPYYSKLKEIAGNMDPGIMQLLICNGRKTTVLLPNEEVYLGEVTPEEEVLTGVWKTPFGYEARAEKVVTKVSGAD